MKSNGEMASDEWVDDYQFYVDASGIRQDKVTFKTTNEIKTSKGWRYKTASGYIKNQWKKINHRLYYFDKNGYMKIGWLKDGAKKYYFKPSGTSQSEEASCRRDGSRLAVITTGLKMTEVSL